MTTRHGSIVDRLMGSLPSGSYLVQSDGASTSEKVVEAVVRKP